MRNFGIALCEMALVGATSKAEKKLADKIWSTALDEVVNTKFTDEEAKRVRQVMGGTR